jgi:hypothetical protein
MNDDMSEFLKDKRRKPKHLHKVKYISMRVREVDHERIMALFGDNAGVREFLIKYAKEHQDHDTSG